MLFFKKDYTPTKYHITRPINSWKPEAKWALIDDVMCETKNAEIWCLVDDPSEQMSKQQLLMYAKWCKCYE